MKPHQYISIRPLFIMRVFLFGIVWLFIDSRVIFAQEITLSITLTNSSGRPHAHIPVILTQPESAEIQNSSTNEKGIVVFNGSRRTHYELKAANHYKPFLVSVPDIPSGNLNVSYKYNAEKDNPELKFRLNEKQLNAMKSELSLIPDSSQIPRSGNELFYATLYLKLFYKEAPIANETLYFQLTATGKTLVHITDVRGQAKVRLPKGDTVVLHFKHDPSFKNFYYYPSQWQYNTHYETEYAGTERIEKLIREQEIRKKEAAVRLAAYRAEMEKRRHEEQVSKMELMKKEYASVPEKPMLGKIIERNNWSVNMLVCDVTGSMSPYIADVMHWTKLHFAMQKNMQLVFFNDGDNIEDDLKKPGKTGGVYYVKPSAYGQILQEAAKAASNGDGGDVDENYIEALLRAQQHLKTGDVLILIADARAGINDMELLSQLKLPVRIILCGHHEGNVIEPDYLKLARHTGGSIHTLEADLLNLSGLKSGEQVKFSGITYRLLNNRFFTD